MSDGFQALLSDLKDPKLYVCVRGVPVFDEHEEQDPTGQRVVRRFDRRFLEVIASRCNARDAKGSLCPLAIGHTMQGKPEQQQPELVGYARNFRVAFHPRLNREVILADYFIRRDQYQKATTYPRTSIELWPAEHPGDPDGWIIDPISLLRRTPRRDLGQWVYHNGHRVLRYSMEDSAMPFPPEPAGGGAPPPPEPEMGMTPPDQGAGPKPHGEMVEEFARHCMSHPYARHLAQHYGMGAGGAPEQPVGNEAPPGGVEEPEAEPFGMASPSATNTRLPRQQARMSPIEQRLSQELAYERQCRITAERRTDLQQLQDMGYCFDLDEELKDVSHLGAQQYAKHLDRIKRSYQTVANMDMIPVQGWAEPGQYARGPGLPSEPGQNIYLQHSGELTEDGLRAVMHYQRVHGIDDFVEARALFLEAIEQQQGGAR